MKGLVLDTGALIALDRGDRGMVVLAAEAKRANAPLRVPAGCVAQAWRDPRRQARLAAFLRSPNVEVVSLGDEDARKIGILLAAVKRKDVIDAHVALCARRSNQTVMTSDPDDIAAMAPGVRVQRV